MTASPARPRHSGFTLLELVLAILVMSIIIGMVFSTARTSLALGNTIVKTQNEEMLYQAFFDLLGQRFASMPGNTRFDLQVSDSGSHYLSDLTLQNAPMGFTWGGQERIAKAVQLSTVKRRSNYLDIVLRYYENDILPESTGGKVNADGEEPFAEIVLLSDVAYFEWRVLDGRSMEWQYDWDLQGRLPLQIELVMAVGARGEESRQIFWVPPKSNPEIRMRQMVQSGGNADASGGANPGGGGIEVNPDGQPGGGQPGGGGRQDGGGRQGGGGRGQSGGGGPPGGGGGR
jgi:prepilin-type N-terminal cleavage/methylation domain-containing protein